MAIFLQRQENIHFTHNSKCSSQIGLNVHVFTAVLYLLVGADSR